MSGVAPDVVFPIDDETLDALEATLATSFTVDEDGTHILVGGELSMAALLDSMSGHGPAQLVRDDVIRALIAEVRRLRSTA